jgi:NAD(P)-dependent dehydrogenase (short-subunit alcohol dehydrogenase family)
MSDFTGLRAVVTGGGSGIGLATAQLLSGRGADVAVLDLDPGAAGEHLPSTAAWPACASARLPPRALLGPRAPLPPHAQIPPRAP